MKVIANRFKKITNREHAHRPVAGGQIGGERRNERSIKQFDRYGQNEYFLFRGTDSIGLCWNYHRKENEPPGLEVSNCMDLLYRGAWGVSFNISVNR